MSVKRMRSRPELIEAALQIIHGIVFPLQLWGTDLLDDLDPKSRPEKLRAFPILFGCIKDSALIIEPTKNKKIEKLVESAESFEDGFLAHNLRDIGSIGSLAAEFCGRASADEQVFLEICRHRFVHGYLDGASKDNRPFWIVGPPEKPGFSKVQKSHQERLEVVSSFCPDGLIFTGISNLFDKFAEATRVYTATIMREFKVDIGEVRLALENDHLIFSDAKRVFDELKVGLDGTQ